LGAFSCVAGDDINADVCADDEISLSSFNRALAHPNLMPMLGEKLGRKLGPRKLMPNGARPSD
jgi:ribosomal protein L1